jgi:hypothetical protein
MQIMLFVHELQYEQISRLHNICNFMIYMPLASYAKKPLYWVCTMEKLYEFLCQYTFSFVASFQANDNRNLILYSCALTHSP